MAVVTKEMGSGRIAVLFGLLVIALVLSPLPLHATDIITESNSISDKYRQNEQIEIYATIINNRTDTLTVKHFNVTIIYAKAVARQVRVAKSIIKDLGNVKLNYHEALSVHVVIPLKTLPPDTYNLTASFLYYYDVGDEKRAFVIVNAKFQLLPFIEIPPAVIFVGIIMSAIIIVYVGYGLAGRISRFSRK